MQHLSRFIRSYALGAVILASCLAFLAPPPATRAASTLVAAFYTTTKAAHYAWLANAHAAPPAPTTVFPAGTMDVGYFLAFSGATPNVTRFQVVARDATGAVVLQGNTHTLLHESGTFSEYFFNQDPAFAAGSYTFQLLVDGVVAATTHFTVNGGLVVPALYSTTQSDIDAWQSSTSDAPPPRTKVFPKGTSTIGYYLSFMGVTPGSTSFRVNIYTAAGAVYLAGNAHTLHYADGFFGNYFYANPAFPNGLYVMKVWIGGVVMRTSPFIVGG